MINRATAKRLVVIWNQKARNAASRDRVREALQTLEERGFGIEQHEPASADETAKLAATAPDDALVVAAGGDGTVHAVAQGLMALQGQSSVSRTGPVLGVIPMGTANDFARSAGIPLDPLDAVAALAQATPRPVDATLVSVDDREQWMINAAAGGNAAEVVRQLDDEAKRRFGPLSYIQAVVEVTADLKRYRFRLQMDNDPPLQLDSFNILLANGRTIATLEVASRASLEDGKLDVVVIKERPLVDTAGVAVDFVAGDYLESEHVVYRRAATVRLDCEREMGFSIDGELHWGRSFEFAVSQSALLALVGDGYSAGAAATSDQ